MTGHARAHSIRVFLVAGPLLRWGLERLVRSAHPQYELLGTAADVAASLPLLEKQHADVVVIVGGELRTEDLAEFCAKCGAKVLLVTSSVDQPSLDSAVMVGVHGIVRTGDKPAVLLRAIDRINAGELWMDRGAVTRIFIAIARQKAAELKDPERAKIASLTARERQMIAAAASDAGASGKVLASRLCISEHTVRNHLSSIYSKLGLYNRRDLYAYARRYGLHETR